MTKMYNGEAIMVVDYTVAADDEAQAKEFIAEIAAEDFPDTDISVVNAKEVK